jgi:glutamate---cysteine ligase / carboxylate-amine ligase
MESVLVVSTDPCRNTVEAGEQLRALRAQVRETAARKGLTIGSAGTHPSAMWEDQRIVARPRYRDLVSALRFVARQELIFGMHVHVAVDDPDKAIHVANGMRVHVPILLGLSANSPFWRAEPRVLPRPGRRSSGRSRGWGSRRRTRTGKTTNSGSSSWSTPA